MLQLGEAGEICMKRIHATISLSLAVLMIASSIPLVGLSLDTTRMSDSPVSEISTAQSGERYTGSIITNTEEYSGFEELGMNGVPNGYNYGHTARGRTDLYYSGLYHSGSHSARVLAEGIGAESANIEAYQYVDDNTYYFDDKLYLSCYYYIDETPDLADGGVQYIRIRMYNGSSYTYLFYYISYNSGFSVSNSTYNGYYLLNSTLDSWHHLQRNLTLDAEEAITGWSVINAELDYFRFHVVSPQFASSPSIGIIDDVSIMTGLAAEAIDNTGFEDPTGGDWNGENSSPGYVSQSSTCLDGEYSANVSVYQEELDAYGYAMIGKYYPYPYALTATGPKSLNIEFDWNYTSTYNGGYDQSAYIQMYVQNSSNSFSIYYYFGNQLDQWSFGNSSWSKYVKDKNFGSNSTWEHTSIDMYELLSELNVNIMAVTSVNFYVTVGEYLNSSSIFLIDNYEVKTYPTFDPGFEQDWFWTSYNPLPGWQSQGSTYPYHNISSDSHSGDHSANLTIRNTDSGFRRQPYVETNPSMLVSAWWKLNWIEEISYSYVHIQLGFEGGYYLYYILANHGSGFSNTSSILYYDTENLNVTGTWVNLLRNFTSDLEPVTTEKLNLTEVRVHGYSASGGNLSILIDDFAIVDSEPPEILSVNQVTSTPVYYSEVIVQTEVTDNLEDIKEVILHYNTGSNWDTKTCDHISGDLYETSIPALPYGTEIDYYISALDWSSREAIDDNGGFYYSYTVGDDIAPTVAIVDWKNDTVVSNSILIEATADDVGSGVDYVEFTVDGVSFYNDSESPYEFNWNTRTVSNGTRTVDTIAHDHAGVTEVDRITLNVQNDVAPPELSTIQINPTTPQYNQAVLVSVAVTDATGVENVTLYYRLDEGTWTSVEMQPSVALYTAEIPAQEWGVEVDYYVVAYDTFGVATDVGIPASYIVGDNIDPTLSASGPSGDIVQGIVTFSYTASDLGSDIEKVELLIDGAMTDSSTAAQGTLEWDTSTFENGEYTIQVVVTDNAGNTASASFTYTVNNPQGLDAIGASLSGMMSEYGFFIGAGSMILLFAVGKVLMNRRSSAGKKKK